MARFTKNAVAGEPVEGRTGWAARRESARRRRNQAQIDRQEVAAIRAAHYASEAQEQAFNPEVRVKDAPTGDFVSDLSDADLVALYRQLHDNRPPAPRAKRPTIERAVRARLAERAAQEQASRGQADETAQQDDPDLIFDDDDGSV